jgi:glycosyltransferase involved in cell wall biosynthesis
MTLGRHRAPCRMGEPSETGVRVSVIIPVYNAEDTIARAVQSVLKQQFESWEIVAVDNGSTDASLRVLQLCAEWVGSERMRICHEGKRGAAAARNAGARVARGEYFAFLDADDEWLPEKLRACVEALDRSESAVVAYSDMMNAGGGRRSTASGSPSLDYLLSERFALFPSATVIRRSAFEACGGFSEQFTNEDLGEDTFIGLRLRELGDFVHIASPLVVYHGSKASTAASKYPGGHRTFTRLVKERYGKRSRGVQRHVREYYCSLLLATTRETFAESPRSAIVNLMRAAIVSPGYASSRVFRKIKAILCGRDERESHEHAKD